MMDGMMAEMTSAMMVDSVVQLDRASLFALACVVIIGLPHGAFDGAIARHLGYGRGWRGLTSFIGLYLGLAAAVVAFWIWQPGLALGLFLLLSAVHFGYGDATGATAVSRMVQIAAHGGVAVFGISLFHLQQVTPLFAALTGGDVAVAVLMAELFPLTMIPGRKKPAEVEGGGDRPPSNTPVGPIIAGCGTETRYYESTTAKFPNPLPTP